MEGKCENTQLSDNQVCRNFCIPDYQIVIKGKAKTCPDHWTTVGGVLDKFI